MSLDDQPSMSPNERRKEVSIYEQHNHLSSESFITRDTVPVEASDEEPDSEVNFRRRCCESVTSGE